jgi:aminopeptidase N
MTFRPALALLCAVSISALGANALAAAPKKAAKPGVALVTSQLPRNAVPVHYVIHVTPDAEKLTFSAITAIDVDIKTASKSLTLNAADLAFSKVTIQKGGDKPISANVSLDAAKQTATFSFPAALAPGRYTINTAYTGKIYQQANGLFALDYKDTAGKQKRALFTQFEAPDARRFVPSWDEPNYKATFDLEANVPDDLMAVSNMPSTVKKIGNGRSEVSFSRTPNMSTYLLFFGLGEFDRITKKAGDTEVGVIMGRGNADKAHYALDASAQIVQYYNDYFGVPFPLPKLDNVAGPGQSQFFSAMENWGAIFTFERVLLDDPKITSARARQRIYQTDAHEIAHQWFGNLVTMQWWDDLWLNEGFASWMESKTTHHFNPQWQSDIDRVAGRERAMGLDAYVTTHPVIQTIKTVEQTSQAFDSITYQKGEAVITMLEGYTGDDVWRDGVRAYMQKHKYGNTKTDDLWTAVEASGAKGLVKIAHDFTKQPGVPLISVENAQCINGNLNVTLKQSEFSRDRKDAAAAKPLRWNVPVIAQTVGNTPVNAIITGGVGQMTVPGCGALLLNGGQSGYYRVLYPNQALVGLIPAFPKLAPIDQVGLLNDNWALARGDYQDMAVPLAFLDAVPTNASQRVIEDNVSDFAYMHDLLRDDASHQAKLASVANTRFAPTLVRLGFAPKSGELLIDANLRSSLIGTLGSLGNADVRAEAKRLFDALDANPAALDGPLRTTWLSIIAYNADKPTWDKIRSLGQKAESNTVKATLYGLLGSAKDTALAADALKLALTEEPGSTTSAGIISAVAGEHPDMAVDFALANLPAVEALVDVSSRSEYVAQLGSGSSNADMPAKLDAYAKAHLTVESRKPVDQAIVSINTRIKSELRIKKGVADWLDAKP